MARTTRASGTYPVYLLLADYLSPPGSVVAFGWSSLYNIVHPLLFELAWAVFRVVQLVKSVTELGLGVDPSVSMCVELRGLMEVVSSGSTRPVKRSKRTLVFQQAPWYRIVFYGRGDRRHIPTFSLCSLGLYELHE